MKDFFIFFPPSNIPMDLGMNKGTGFINALNWIKSLTPADFQNTTHICAAIDSNLV